MKNWLTQVAAGLFAVAALASCKKDEVKATLTPSNAMTLAANRTSVVLTQPNAAQTAVTYTWTPISKLDWSGTDYAYAPAVTYQLQVSTTGNNFGAPATIAAGNGPTTAVTVEALNAALVKIGLAPNAAASVLVRMAAVVGSDNISFHSEAVALTATPYKVCVAPNADTWSIIGPAGVDWNTDVPLTYNCDTRTYDVTRALNAGDFKFRKNNDWGTNYGSAVATGGPVALNGANITVATAGTYTIKLDLNNQTFSIR